MVVHVDGQVLRMYHKPILYNRDFAEIFKMEVIEIIYYLY